MNLNNKWFRAALPALLIHVSIGTVYCWSSFKANIAEEIGFSAGVVEWAFSLAIFFLGMSAAFMGKFVEKNIKLSALLSTIFFTIGMLGTGLAIHYKSLIGLYLFYGIIMGIGLGIGYITPVKNLMLWFHQHKGLGTGLAVAGFGLAKTIASPVMEWLMNDYGLVSMFYILGLIYFVMMLAGYDLIKRPPNYQETSSNEKQLSTKEIIKQPVFIGIWLMFFLNISCGLALISQEKDILKIILPNLGYSAVAISGVVGTVLAIDAIFNALGRLGFASLSDKLKRREYSYLILFALSVLVCLLVAVFGAIEQNILWLVLMMLFVVNAGYGGGFSTLPVLLQEHFGMHSISRIHGLTLSAWAIAGIFGNQLASVIVNYLGAGYQTVVWVIMILFLLAGIICWRVTKIGLKVNIK